MLLVHASYAAAARCLGSPSRLSAGSLGRGRHRPSVIPDTLTTRTPEAARLRTAAMDAALVDFVNGLPSLSRALVSTFVDIADGKAVVEAAQHVLGCSEADAHASLAALSGVDAGRLERCEVRAQLDALDALRRKRQTPSGHVPRTVTTAPHARDKALCDACRDLCGDEVAADVAEALRPPDPRALCDAAARRHRSLVVVELAARVLRKGGAAKAEVKLVSKDRWELAGTDRQKFSSGAAVANVRRALAALRSSRILDQKMRLRCAVPASAVAAGDAEALRRVVRVALDALARGAVAPDSSDSDVEAPRASPPPSSPPPKRPSPPCDEPPPPPRGRARPAPRRHQCLRPRAAASIISQSHTPARRAALDLPVRARHARAPSELGREFDVRAAPRRDAAPRGAAHRRKSARAHGERRRAQGLPAAARPREAARAVRSPAPPGPAAAHASQSLAAPPTSGAGAAPAAAR